MNTTTTIRIDTETHRRLSAIAKASGRPLIDVVRSATEALERAEFAQLVTGQIERLRADPERWVDYLGEAERVNVGDGLGR